MTEPLASGAGVNKAKPNRSCARSGGPDECESRHDGRMEGEPVSLRRAAYSTADRDQGQGNP